MQSITIKDMQFYIRKLLVLSMIGGEKRKYITSQISKLSKSSSQKRCSEME